jgi:type I pantothenate kinase
VKAVDAVLAAVGDARLIGITGGVAAGKSTLAAAVGLALGAPVVATDGFLRSNADLADAGLTHRKGFPESFDGDALGAGLDAWRATGRMAVPVYSHLAYDLTGEVVVVAGERLVVEGLHLGHPALGVGVGAPAGRSVGVGAHAGRSVRDRFDLLVHLDAADDDLARWYLDRFRELRAAAAADPAAFLHQFRDVDGAVLDGMAMDVWTGVNLVVLEEEVRPWAGEADLVLRLGPDHQVVEVVER